MDLYVTLIPDLRNIVTEYFGDVIFSRGEEARDEVTFATAEEFKKSKATDCIFINYEITSTDHRNNPDIPKTLLRCSGVPKIKTHTFAYMFQYLKFNGDISQWDVSSVTNMYGMFSVSKFNGDISQWDVSRVTNMQDMFNSSKFNGDISKWNVSSVTDMSFMFAHSQFDDDLSQWDFLSVVNVGWMFSYSPLTKEIVQAWDNFKNHNINKMFE
jgi:surface protein